MKLGGSDQWGNIVSGVDLIRRRAAGTPIGEPIGLTTSLLLTSTGKKMGKGEDNALWLSPDRAGPFQFYQYFIGLSDEDAKNTCRLLLPQEEAELEAVISEHAARPELRSLQVFLAAKMTALVHSAEAASLADSASAKIYGPSASVLLTDDELAQCPRICMPRSELLAIDLKSLLLKCYPTIPRRTHPVLF